MSGKLFVFIVVLAAWAAVGVVGDIGRDPSVAAGPPAPRSYAATVEVEAIRVISYLDDQGVEHAPDSTLIAPAPLQGPRDFTVIVGPQRIVPTPVARGIEPR